MHNSIPLFWRLKRGKYNLVGTRCDKCDITYFPPRSICPACGAVGLSVHKLPETGKVVTYTVIHVAPDGFDAPYNISIIELMDGTMVTGQVVGSPRDLTVGSAVCAVFRKINETGEGLINYGFKFELVECGY